MKTDLTKFNVDSDLMKKSFQLSVKELEAVLDRKKSFTDITKLAATTLNSYSKIRSTEVHEKGLEIMLMKQDVKQLPEK